jgi:DNA-binding transcriptional LysR family regulator
MLDLHRLRVFRSVVASGSVQAAAANLGYTPSAVSQHITALQKEVGLTLLERAGRGLRPTAAGFALAAEADGVLARIGEAETLVSDLRTGRTGRLSIAYFASVGSVWLPSVVHRLSEEFPGVRLDLRLSDNAPDRPDDRADIHLIVARHDFVTGRGFTTHHLLDDPYIVALPDTHPLAASGTVELSDLKHERWIDNDFAAGWCRQNLLDSCAAAGFRPAFHVETHDYHAALAFVAAGIGITVLPTLGATDPPAGVALRHLANPTPVRSIHAVVRDAVAITPPARAALELLRAEAALGAPETALAG